MEYPVTIFNLRLLFLILVTAFLPWTAWAAHPSDQFTFILPAPALHQTLQNNLPLAIRPDSSSFDGTLSIDSIDKLSIHDKMISLHGIISGKDMNITTKIAGQKIKIKLGHITLPFNCDLLLRFDQAARQLFITPRFKTSADDNSNAQALIPLLSALSNREYPVDLTELHTLKPRVDGHDLNLQMEPVQIEARDNQLILGLRPQQNKSN
jgi:hypothetical protein